jgi:hypothetical protein
MQARTHSLDELFWDIFQPSFSFPGGKDTIQTAYHCAVVKVPFSLKFEKFLKFL